MYLAVAQSARITANPPFLAIYVEGYTTLHVTYMYTLTLCIAIIKLLLLLYTMGVLAKILPFRHEFDEVMSEALTAPN